MLTDTFIKTVKPQEKTKKYSDSGGLFLQVTTNGGKWWRLAYRFQGKQKLLSLGVYPEISLAQARKRRDDARKLLAEGIDPGEHRKAVATLIDTEVETFEKVAREWFLKFSPSWVQSHADRTLRRLERDVFPRIGSRPIAEINPPEVLMVLRRMEDRGVLETAHRASQNIGQVFRYAVATGRATMDPIRRDGEGEPAIFKCRLIGKRVGQHRCGIRPRHAIHGKHEVGSGAQTVRIGSDDGHV